MANDIFSHARGLNGATAADFMSPWPTNYRPFLNPAALQVLLLHLIVKFTYIFL
jgi:hypothetical protein